MKYISYKRAIDKMNAQAARLVKCCTNASPSGKMHYVIPGGPVTDEIAEKIKAHPQIVDGKDGLFPDMEQTWRMLR